MMKGKGQYLYQTNIVNIEQLLLSGGREGLSEKEIINAIDGVYKDPDTYDRLLYRDLGERYADYEVKKCNLYTEINGESIKLSADCVNGWKALLGICGGKVSEMLREYEKLRSLISAHLVWPQHRIPTINTERYLRFDDRVDYTLFDIERFFEISQSLKLESKAAESKGLSECRLFNAYKQVKTFLWLKSFGTFPVFIEKMKLERFVDGRCRVRDLGGKSNNDVITQYPDDKPRFTSLYWNNLIKRLNATSQNV